MEKLEETPLPSIWRRENTSRVARMVQKHFYKTVMPNIFFPSGNWPVFVPWFLSDAPNESRESANSGSAGFPRCCHWWKSDSVPAVPSGHRIPVKLRFAESPDAVMQRNMASCDRAQCGKWMSIPGDSLAALLLKGFFFFFPFLLVGENSRKEEVVWCMRPTARQKAVLDA